MGLRGPKPTQIISTEWSANLAYAIGLLVADGCISSKGLIDLTSKDEEQLLNFLKCIGKSYKISKKKSGYSTKEYLRIQFKSIVFSNFLQSIGITSKKSKTIGGVLVPNEFFFDYLRGYLDGDGYFYSYWDSRWKSSHMFYISFACGSREHVLWLKNRLKNLIGITGHITYHPKKDFYQLKYAKRESLEIIERMYYNPNVICLSRKRDKINKAIDIEQEQQDKYI